MPDVQLSWSLSPTSSSKVDGQRLYRSATSSPSFPTDYTEIASLSDSATSFTDTGVASGDYTYAVTAFNSAGESSPTTDTVSVSAAAIELTGLVGAVGLAQPTTGDADLAQPTTGDADLAQPTTGDADLEQPTAGDRDNDEDS